LGSNQNRNEENDNLGIYGADSKPEAPVGGKFSGGGLGKYQGGGLGNYGRHGGI
jgi:hypothetical protein